MRTRLPRYIILPVLIFIYATVMAWTNREGFLSPASRPTYIIISVVELMAIIALFFFLRKKEELKRKREDLSKRYDKIEN